MILSRLSTVAIAALLSISSSASAADSSLQLQITGRRHLKPNNNIAQQVKNDKAQGRKSKFTITAKKAGGSPGQTKKFNVQLADSAVQAGATVITNTGETHVVTADEINDILVTEPDDDKTIGLIGVDTTTGKTHGIIVNNLPEANTIISQGAEEDAFAYDAPTFQEPEWKCSSPDHKHDIHEPEEPVSVSELGGDDAEMIDRHLGEHHHHHHHHDDHDHSHHDHGHLNVHDALDDLRRQLRGSSVRLGKKQRVLQTGAPYEYQVDVYVEVDQDLCNTQGDTAVCPGTATENYVNAIFTGANTVYEPEIHTHLNVIAIAYTDLYDVATGTSNALDIMRTNFATAYGTPFHYEGADLHHALLGKGLGGGIAYVGVLCRPDYGYGLSASLTGSYTSMDAATVWDMKVFTHELGHNFGSGHTHDITQYDPVVDTCGSSCPASVPSDSATIMSYCHQCAGYGSIEYTFGGTYVSGDRKVASSYSNVPLAGSVTNNAKRVNVEMYNHVRTSTDSYFPGCLDVTPKCQVDSDCPDEACSVNVCTEYGTCELQAPSANCCGNGVCDGQEDWQSCPQDGCSPPPGDCSAGGCPTIATEFCSSCNGGITNMFKVTAIADLVITRLTTFTYTAGSGSVKVFGKSGDFAGSEYNAAAWTQHYSGNISVGSWSQVALPRFTDTIFVPAGSSYSFYVSSTLSGGWNMLFTAGLTEDTVFTQNSDMQVYVGKGGTCVSPGDGGCGMYSGGVLFNGVLEYSTVASSTPAPVTPGPTPNPTNDPVTQSPITNSPITSSPIANSPVTSSPTPPPTPIPITPGPTDAPVTPAPVTSNPTNPPSPPPSPPPTPDPTPDPTPFPVTSNPTNPPTPPPSPPPTPAPTTDAPVTSAPTNPPTPQPTPNPTNPPTPPPSPPPTTPAPTDPPVVIVVKQLCIKDGNLPGADICTDGSTSGTCDGKSEGSSCGQGKKCRFESCVGGPGPSPTNPPVSAPTDPPVVVPTDPPVVAPTNPPVAACGARRASCSTGGDCCSGSCSIDRKGNGKCD